jgi:hypothetical protein
LDDLVHFANTANYLDMAFVIDAACAAIALNWRKITKDPRTGQPQALSPQDDMLIINAHKILFDSHYEDLYEKIEKT